MMPIRTLAIIKYLAILGVAGLFPVTGCQKTQPSMDSQIVGLWEMDTGTSAQLVKKNAKTKTEKKAAALPLLPRLRFEFQADGTVKYGFMLGNLPPSEGTYELKQRTANSAVLEITFQQQVDKYKITLVNDDQLEMELLNPSPTRPGPERSTLKRLRSNEN